MTEQINTYLDNSFDLNQADNYTLLIQISESSFAHAVINDKQLLAWNASNSLIELIDPQDLSALLSATYKKVVIGLPANGFTLIPNALFSTERIGEFARLLNLQPDEKVLAQPLDADNHIIYKVVENLVTAIQKLGLQNAVYLNKGWLTAIAQSNPANDDLYLHTENNQAQFLYFVNDKICFYNSFEFKSEDDLAYYAAVVTKELELDARNINLKLSGNILQESKYGARLMEFFPKIVLNDLKVLDLPEHLSSQQLLTLSALSLCGSSEAL